MKAMHMPDVEVCGLLKNIHFPSVLKFVSALQAKSIHNCSSPAEIKSVSFSYFPK